jgi:hypothetical protein
MRYPFAGIGRGPRLPAGVVEVMCETAVALAIAAAICVSVASLSAHLKEAGTVRASASVAMPAEAAAAARHFN